MNPALLIGACFAGAATCGLGALANVRKARLIEDTPTSRIRSAHQGYVELLGVAEPADSGALTAPLSGDRCLWYQYRIERYQGGNKARWVTVEQDGSEQAFYLRDATGRSRVLPRGAEVSAALRRQWTGSTRDPRQPPQRSLLGGLVRPRYRYTELRIADGQPLYVMGSFSTRHPPSLHRQTQDRSRQLLSQWKQDQRALLRRFDRNGDGAIDQEEWRQARQEAKEEAASTLEDAPPMRPEHTIAKPDDGRPFLISTADPEQMAQRYRLRSALSLGGLAGLSILGCWLLLNAWTA